MRTRSVIAHSVVTAGLALVIMYGRAGAQQSTRDLAAAAQNPIAAMYSLPFQNNTYFRVGPTHDDTAND